MYNKTFHYASANLTGESTVDKFGNVTHYEECNCANGLLGTRLMCHCPYQDARFNSTLDEDYLS